jgi:hypothetical protein
MKHSARLQSLAFFIDKQSDLVDNNENSRYRGKGIEP